MMKSDHTLGMKHTPEDYGRVLVLYGGLSAEREVSLKSGKAVFDALVASGIDARLIDVGEQVIECLQQEAGDRVFIALHGSGGEDGRIQALLEFFGLPYTGSGVQGSAIAMDKLKSKQIFMSSGIPTPPWSLLAESTLSLVVDELGADLMVKPAHEGSSIGMTPVSDLDELKRAYEQASRYDHSVLAEKMIRGAEYTVGILDGVALPAIKLETEHRFYDYDAKYIADDTRYICPCGLSEEKEQELKALAEAAFTALGCQGWGRADVMADADGNFYVLEINTVPGMTDHSLVPMAAKHQGMSFEQLVVAILDQTMEPEHGRA